MKVTKGAVTAAVRLVAATSTRRTNSTNRFVPTDLVAELRRQLELSGLAPEIEEQRRRLELTERARIDRAATELYGERRSGSARVR